MHVFWESSSGAGWTAAGTEVCPRVFQFCITGFFNGRIFIRRIQKIQAVLGNVEAVGKQTPFRILNLRMEVRGQDTLELVEVFPGLSDRRVHTDTSPC